MTAYCSCGRAFDSLHALQEHAREMGGLLHGDALPEIKLSLCANHGLEECDLCGTYLVMPTVTDEQRAVATAKLTAAAIDYTHGRITSGELVRIAKEYPR